MYEIVVGVGTDVDRALAQTEAITDLPGHEEIRATLVHVFEGSDGSLENVESVAEARTALDEAGVEVRAEAARGDPAMNILDAAERHDADCICVAGRDRSPTGKAIFGSVTQDVIVGTRRPTLVCTASES
jgi:nucleotide-binding universal stress UspA family protein